jgi:hypothetical protein
MDLRFERVALEKPEHVNVIVGQAHFIKTVEDLHETLATHTPAAKFGLAFVESSGPCLVRVSGNDAAMSELAARNALRVGAGHTFYIFLDGAFPIAVLNAIKEVQEVCLVYCATANPLEIIVAESAQGRGIMGVIDGQAPKGIETDEDKAKRKELLRQFGYKA